MKKYNVLYVDPPWEYRNKKTGGSLTSGSSSKYKTLSVDELCSLPINNITEKNSVIFMWTTVPMLFGAYKVMSSWGYSYKTMITWRKIMSLGMGYWFRGQTEHVLLGVRGNVKAFRCQRCNFIQTKSLKHSEKPEEFRQLIELATINMPNRKMIELFARKKVDGWDQTGFDVDGNDIRDFLNG